MALVKKIGTPTGAVAESKVSAINVREAEAQRKKARTPARSSERLPSF
jgi:hypothetical protein